ncbi:MAG: guanylate kinase [Oligoflexus sp.]
MSVYVVSAPSGTGKTTLNRRLIEEHQEIEMSVSHTTRPPRQGEQDGVHYHFINPTAFREMVANQAFVEWAEVHGNLYGTSLSELERIRGLGKKALLEIDVQGWQKAAPLLPDAVSIFILPPSLAALWQRLESRGSDDLATRWLRLKNAHEEIINAYNYRYFIVNEKLETAYQKLKSIVVNGKSEEANSSEEGLRLCQQLNQEFEYADWIKRLKASLG